MATPPVFFKGEKLRKVYPRRFILTNGCFLIFDSDKHTTSGVYETDRLKL